MAIPQNYTFSNLVNSQSTINNRLFNQNINIAYSLNSINLISMFTEIDKEYKYKGFSTTVNTVTDYYILLNIINLYAYMKSIYTDVTDWNTFINKTGLSKTISKLNCNNIHHRELINTLFNT
jgi:hypothetical protein